jgi:pyrroloquinoline-quinone synthase
MSRATYVTASADAALRRIALLGNPYFASLSGGNMPLAHFRTTQEQFFFAVRYYAQPIAALISRIPDPAGRLDLLHNLVEEHGDFKEEGFHQNTFREFLASIGGRSPDVAGVPMGPAAHAFNSILIGVCTNDELEVGICCLGIIEQAFAGVSEVIGRVVVERGWVSSKDLVHYALHAELDVRHAEDFFAIVEPSFGDPRRRSLIDQGLALGAYAFDQLYRSLLIEAEAVDA